MRDRGNDNLLSRVNVELRVGAETSNVVTGFDGAFSFGEVAGPATVSTTADGYASYSQSLDVRADVSVEIHLERNTGRSAACGEAPDVGNRLLPIFSQPFLGDFRLTNYFDHDLPLQFADVNGYQLTACGDRIFGAIDGHNGYDWLLPLGTPVLAVAAGQVSVAGMDPPFLCPPLGRIVSDQRFVEIRHPPASGESFSSVYVHLQRLDVVTGQQVTAGQTLGLSGSTGCSTEPHLHLAVWRHTSTNTGGPVRVDPYGWEGQIHDPWAQNPSGSASFWLWRPGEAPRLSQ